MEPPTASTAITDLPCNATPTNSTSPKLSSPIAVASNPSPEEFPDVGVAQLSSDKSNYAFNQTQPNIKIEHVHSDYQCHYNIPPMVFVPSTNSNTASATIGTNNNITTTTSCSPVQHQNVGTILAENNAMLQNTPIATGPTYTAPPSNNQANNNFYSHHSHNQQDASDSTLQYGNTLNPLR